MDMPDDGTRTEGGRVLSLTSLATFASEQITAKDFFALDVDEKIKVELIGGALIMSPSARYWHTLAGFRLARVLEDTLGDQFLFVTDTDVAIDDVTVVRPDVFVVDPVKPGTDRVGTAEEVLLAVEIVSPGSKTMDRRVKPELYRNAGILSWRIERDRERLFLVETPVVGEERTHLGTATLVVAGVTVTVDLDAIARYAFRTDRLT
jgi:Uma2 family endonuclease